VKGELGEGKEMCMGFDLEGRAGPTLDREGKERSEKRGRKAGGRFGSFGRGLGQRLGCLYLLFYGFFIHFQHCLIFQLFQSDFLITDKTNETN